MSALAPTHYTFNTGPQLVTGATCTGLSLTTASKYLYVLNLPPDAPMGGQLVVDTCTVNGTVGGGDTVSGGTIMVYCVGVYLAAQWPHLLQCQYLTTQAVPFHAICCIVQVLWVGVGCPTAADGSDYRCVAGNDDTAGCGSGLASRVTVSPVVKRTYYALVGGYNNGQVYYTLGYNYIPPSPTSSITASASSTATASLSYGATASETASASGTASISATGTKSLGWVSASSTVTPSRTATGSLTASPTASNSPTGSLTAGATNTQTSTQTMSISLTSSQTPSRTQTPSSTRSGSCPPAVEVSGDIGDVSVRIDPASTVGMFTGTCTGYSLDGYRKALVKITLTSPVGGSFAIGNCGSATFDSVIYAGTGCGFSAANFGCMAGNDNACGLQSQVTVPTITSSVIYVLVGVYANGAPPASNFTLSWVYNAPSATST